MATFRNQAILSYNGASTTSNVVVGEVTEVLSAQKNAPVGTYQPGETHSYVVSIVNSGTAPFTGLTVSDDLGAYTFGTPATTLTPLTYVNDSVALYINGVLQADPAVTAGPPLTFTGINVPAGGNAVLIYEARVNEFADPTGTITNTATVSGGGLTAPVTAPATVNGESNVLLSITKAVSPVPVAENGRLTYTFVIENYGATAAATTDNLTVSDTFDPILTDLTVTLNGTVLTAPGQYTYDETTGLFTTLPGQITVPAATVTQDPVTGVYTTTPGVATLTVTGTV